jgi:hypothetical protein
MRISRSLLIALSFCCLTFDGCKGKDIDVKEIAEEWFTKQAVGSLGKKFLEKVKCSRFVTHFEETYPNYYGTKPEANKIQVTKVVITNIMFQFYVLLSLSKFDSVKSNVKSSETDEIFKIMQSNILKIRKKQSSRRAASLQTIL